MSITPRPDLDGVALRRRRGNVLDMNVEQPVGELLGRAAGIAAGANRMADVDAQADAAVEPLDLLVGHVGRRDRLVARPVIVDGHANVVLLHFFVDQRQQVGHWASATITLHSGGLGVLEGSIHVGRLLHEDHAAAVQVDARRLHLGRGLGDLLGRAVERQMNGLQTDVLQPDAGTS